MPDRSVLPILLPYLLAWLLVINLITWAVFRWDKAAAGANRRRVRERTLFLLAAAGGCAGALWGMYGHRQRHKAQKSGFVRVILAITAAYGMLGVALGLLLTTR